MIAGTITKSINNMQKKDDAPRNYVGASSIGHPCERKIWYELKGKPKEYTSEQLRTFEIGKRLESMILDDVEKSGIPVSRDHNQYMDSYVPRLCGTPDAIIFFEESGHAILEIKTAKDSSFRTFQKKGLKLWNEAYYAQIQTYMGLTGLNEAFIIALNKDTSELHDEHVLFDEIFFEGIRAKAKKIIESENEPDKLSDSPMFYMCKMCSFKKTCHTTSISIEEK